MKKSYFVAYFAVLLLIGACADTNSNLKQNKSLVIKSNDELFNKGNLSFADERFSSDYAGRGPEVIKEYIGALRTAFPDIQVTIDPIIAEGNITAWRRTHTGTHNGVYNGFQPTGKKITWEAIVMSRYDEDGKVVEEWGAGNLTEVLRDEISETSYDEVLKTSDQYFKAMKTLNVDSVLAFWADDLQIISKENDINGRDELRDLLGNLYKGLKLHELAINSRNIDASDILAVEVFEYAETMSINDGELQTLKGKQISIWKKIDGSWKISKVTIIPTTDDPIHDSF